MTQSIPDPTAFIRQTMPLCATLGMSASVFGKDQVVMEMAWREDLCTANGILHGGALMALADSCGATAAYANLPRGAAGTSTIESKTNFLGAVRSGTVTATSTPLHVGGSTIVVETELRNEGRLVGKVTQTQSVLRAR